MGYVFLTGGARSGKSALAVEFAARSGRPVTFVATAEALDDEMTERIARHRASRPQGWTTVEEPLDPVGGVGSSPADHFVVLDCLTLFVANLIEAGWGDEEVKAEAERLAGEMAAREAGGVVVSNEVGWGIVPAEPLARRYRDLLGTVNAVVAGRADRAWLMVAGRVVELQGAGQRG